MSRFSCSPRIVLAALTVALFSASMAQAATPAEATSAAARLARMAPGTATSCKVGQGGNIDCLVDNVRTTVPECEGDYAWGQVSAKDGLTLESAFDKSQGKSTVHLGRSQFVCIAAIAGNQQLPERYYVIAFPTGKVPGCKDNDLCQERPQSWVGTKPTTPCQWIGKDGDFTGACAAGWANPDDIEVFSMGLQ